MTEVPEMFGAETILMDRAADEQVFQDITLLINNFKQYFVSHGQEIYENPSPGNKDGGITTLEEKSLGCTQKGTATVSDVLRYGVRSTKPGLNLIEGPGNDLVSVTALAAAGAHLVLFTTGRGRRSGPVPTVKIATNSELSKRKSIGSILMRELYWRVKPWMSFMRISWRSSFIWPRALTRRKMNGTASGKYPF